MGQADDFIEEVVFWLDITDVPLTIEEKAKQVDGEFYSDDCFGICVLYSRESGEYSLSPDEKDTTIYYVDNDGNKHWYMAEISKELMDEIIAECEKAIAEELMTNG